MASLHSSMAEEMEKKKEEEKKQKNLKKARRCRKEWWRLGFKSVFDNYDYTKHLVNDSILSSFDKITQSFTFWFDFLSISLALKHS